MANIKILGIAGSLRKGSFNRMALKAAQGLVPAGATLEIARAARPAGLQPGQREDPPAAVTELKAKIRAADAILLVTPEYNYSDPRRAQERHRLGVAALRRQRLEGQAGGHHGRLRRRARHGARAVSPAPDAWCFSTCRRSTSPR